MTTRSRVLLALVAGLVLLVCALSLFRAAQSGSARTGSPPAATSSSSARVTDSETGLVWVDESALNPEAKTTLAAIRTGGPFRYPKNDGVTFGNREGLLPAKTRGFYREYTVSTPGSADRGPRRIIAAENGTKFYTADHYGSFQRIREGA